MFTPLDPLVLGTIALGVIALLLFGWVIRLEMKIRRLCAGKSGSSLEEVIQHLHEDQKQIRTFRADVEQYLAAVERRLRRSIQGVEAVRFNPFQGSGDGGNQSFSIAFVDEEGNGVVMSGLYAREHTRVYSKPLVNHMCEYELTDEERDVIEKARKKLDGAGR